MIEFEPVEHVYKVDGRITPSVTEILQPYTDLQFVDRELLRRAAEFGTHVHEATHLYDMDMLDTDSLDPALHPYLLAWQQFLEDTGATVLASELRVASKRFGYAGTLDRLVYWGNSERFIDIKAGNVVPKTVGPQLAAYSEAYSEQHGKRNRGRHCIHLKGDGTYANHRLTDPRDWNIFQSALVLHRWYYKGKS